LENKTPAPFQDAKPYAQLLIFIGITCISFFILGIITVVMQQSGAINLLTLQDAANYANNSVVKDFRVYQLLSDVFLFIIPAIVIAFLVTKQKLQYLQVSSIGSFSLLIMGVITILASMPFIGFIGELNARIPLPDLLQKMEDSGDAIEAALMAHHTVNDLIWNLIVIALAAAISEELFFRAGMQKIIIAMSKNIHVGIWITAIIFSAIHLQFSGFFPRMLLGVFLGYLFVWSGSIWVNIFAHFVFNGIQIFVQYLQDAKASNRVLDKMCSQTPDYISVIISTVLTAALLVVVYRLSRKKDEVVIP
jgi:uncharacterized protein